MVKFEVEKRPVLTELRRICAQKIKQQLDIGFIEVIEWNHWAIKVKENIGNLNFKIYLLRGEIIWRVTKLKI